jgi:uncharacterized membrane protein
VNNGNGNGNGNGKGIGVGSAFGALFFALGALLLFSFGFAFFLILPFFIFLGGIVAMIVSDRKQDSGQVAERKAHQEEAKSAEAAG